MWIVGGVVRTYHLSIYGVLIFVRFTLLSLILFSSGDCFLTADDGMRRFHSTEVCIGVRRMILGLRASGNGSD